MKKQVLVKIKVRNDDTYGIEKNMDEARIPSESEEPEEGYEDFCEDEAEGEVSAFPSEGMEIVTDGEIYYKDGRFELKYVETDASDMSNEITTVSFAAEEPGVITMERNGACRTAMVFEAGRRYICIYDVSGMVLELVVRTYNLENKLGENGGTLRLGYTLENGGVTISRVKMEIELRIK